ncbi:MAG: hypothetical protein V7708_18415 [Oceanicoccus sp.]
MKLINIYEDRDEAEDAEKKIDGEKRLVSDREDNQVIYKLFGQASWTNFYKLGMFNLAELQQLLDRRKNGQNYDLNRHIEIINMLKYSANSFDIEVPSHWM